MKKTTLLLLSLGCNPPPPASPPPVASEVGESCTRTADCRRGLRCVDRACLTAESAKRAIKRRGRYAMPTTGYAQPRYPASAVPDAGPRPDVNLAPLPTPMPGIAAPVPPPVGYVQPKHTKPATLGTTVHVATPPPAGEPAPVAGANYDFPPLPPDGIPTPPTPPALPPGTEGAVLPPNPDGGPPPAAP